MFISNTVFQLAYYVKEHMSHSFQIQHFDPAGSSSSSITYALVSRRMNWRRNNCISSSTFRRNLSHKQVKWVDWIFTAEGKFKSNTQLQLVNTEPVDMPVR